MAVQAAPRVAMTAQTAPRRRPLPLSVLIIAVPALIGVVRLALALRHPFLAGGDAAFMELATRRALRARQALGPYSRFGWNHPGPAVFYLFAPLYWLTGEHSRSLFLSAWLLNIGSAVAVVLLVRRWAGEGAGRVVAVVLAGFLAATGFGPLINPWNPSLLALPFLLLAVLAAGAALGSARALVGSAVVGSYLVQTHLGTLPVVGVALLLAAGGWFAARRRIATPARRPAGRPVWAAGLVLLGLLWAGPVAEEVFGSPGNAERLVDFFSDPPDGYATGHPVDDALAAVADEATRPFLGDAAGAGLDGGRAGLLLGLALVGGVVAVTSRRRCPLAAGLGALGATTVAVAVISTTRVLGPLEPYLFAWTPALIVLPVMAAGLAASDGLRRLAAGRASGGRLVRAAGPLGAVAATAAAAVLVSATVHHATISYQDSPDARSAAEVIEAHVGHDRHRVFRIHVVDGQFQMSSLLLQLERDGYRFRMSPSYGLYGGSTGRAPAADAPIVVVGTDISPKPPGAAPLATVGPFVLSTVATL